MNTASMIKVLRYKSEHIKTKIKPKFFSEVADRLEQQPRWIPIEEELPPRDKNVLISYGYILNPIITIGTFDGCGFKHMAGMCWMPMDLVKAWMPLPDAYKGETNETN